MNVKYRYWITGFFCIGTLGIFQCMSVQFIELVSWGNVQKISKRFIFKTLFLLLLIASYMVISGEQGINAMPGGCEIKSIEINVSPAPTESDTEDFRIMCGSAGQIKWNGIKSSANLTNQTSTGKPTLQYPASNSRVWDKIRYK
ncbi:hypothetical protein FPQ10_07970 [Allobacillus sp. SKP2-8]|uniref:hypothetical protein n=1 Tax=unclassified Allobacillus TaxID=2628859 RepID=UPI001182E15E|nr:hypothetical protein [Allobacillus sp. SKP2-8]TSJ66081.1 hypothetical protein FPQ10_07970 [Allobacillus sp. SKP2-8]